MKNSCVWYLIYVQKLAVLAGITVHCLFTSNRLSLGVDMLGFNCQSADSMLEQMQNHQYAILCFSLAVGL